MSRCWPLSRAMASYIHHSYRTRTHSKNLTLYCLDTLIVAVVDSFLYEIHMVNYMSEREKQSIQVKVIASLVQSFRTARCATCEAVQLPVQVNVFHP